MTVDSFLKLKGNEALTRTSARKNFGSGESTIKVRSKKESKVSFLQLKQKAMQDLISRVLLTARSLIFHAECIWT